MKDYGKVFLVECFEFLSDNVHSNYTIHPFHQHLSNIKHANLTNTFIPVQMFSMQAAQFVNITSSLIYINLEGYSEKAADHLLMWLHHLTNDGAVCGNLGNDETIRKELSEYALTNGYLFEIKDAGFWIIRSESMN